MMHQKQGRWRWQPGKLGYRSLLRSEFQVGIGFLGIPNEPDEE